MLKFLRTICPEHLIEEIEGDLIQQFYDDCHRWGARRAKRKLVWNTLLHFRPGIILRNKLTFEPIRTVMIRNYFKIAWRNIGHHKAFSAINVFGLSLGIACSILIFTLVNYHLSFDDFHPDSSRIYRVVSEFDYESTEYYPWVPQPLGKAFQYDFSFAEKTARIRAYHSVMVSFPEEEGDKKFQEENIVAFAEPAFFDIFNFPLIEGNPKTILTAPNTALITQKLAQKYFNTEHVIGKIIRVTSFDKQVDFTITGVLKDMPANSDRKQQIYLSYANLKDYNAYYASDNSWGSVNRGMECFVLLNPGVTKKVVEKAFPSFVKKYYNEEDAKITQFKLQPLADIHFNPIFGGAINKQYLWVLALTGFFLTAIACINFINLAAAQSLNRSKEVGIRKVLGSRRFQLFLQFMVETSIIAFFAIVFAYILAKLVLPHLNSLFKEQLTLTLLQQWQLPVFIVLLMLLVIFLAGSYPGLVLAKLQPVSALKGKLSQQNTGGFSMRRTLIIIQFAISQILIISMIVIAGQMRYAKTSDLGFNKEAIVMLPIPEDDKTKMNTLQAHLAEVAGVEQASLCYEAPASEANSFTSVRFDNHPKDEPWEINLKDADDQYVATFGLQLVAGRNLVPSDTLRGMLVNETFVKKLGLSSAEDVIGKSLGLNGGTINSTIVGVVKDFYTHSFHEAISPLCIMVNYDRFRHFAIKIDLHHAQSALDSFGKIWNETYHNHVFSYHFLDESIAKFYEMDLVILKLVIGFACMAMLISCLGLYGMVTFMAVRKTKEIGVRKVLGASVHNILWLYGKEFTFLLVIAFFIAAPVAWAIMDQWLQNFTYRIPINPGSFLLALTGTFILATITVAYHSLKSALSNPVKSLGTE